MCGVVAFLDQLSRNLEDGVRIQAELRRRNISIVAIRENIDPREWRTAAKFFRWPMLAQETCEVDWASVRISLEMHRARTNGKQVDRLPVLSGEQVEQCRRMASEGAGLRHIALVMGCSPVTVKKVPGRAGSCSISSLAVYTLHESANAPPWKG